MLSFDIISIHIITLGSQIEEFVHHGLIYYTIENPHLETLGGSVSFQCGINIFSLFIYKLHQQTAGLFFINGSKVFFFFLYCMGVCKLVGGGVFWFVGDFCSN
jgi:hypothetical protein